jgi:adenosylcobinamide-GDP ribazoletransferase
VPVGAAGAPDARALAWLPLVGCAIGALAGVAAWGASFVAPEPFVVATAFAASIVLSGAVHLDGLLDACDALAASVPPERRLEIMKDPRHGTFAVAGFAVVGVWWLAALWSIPPGVLPFALAFSAGTARAAAVLNAYALPYGRTDASARAFASRPPAAVLGLEAAGLAGLALAAHAPLWIAAGATAAVAALALGRAMARRLGGVLVGDAYGAIVVILDVALLSAIALLQGH